ncbi:MAG TPA: hypothetical protein VJN43_14380 [Bryobacteraceae bacterium]|nr:hypothetical protein [Bryobacteraceae bacterium]
MKCVTGPLTSAQLLEEIPEIVRLLASNGVDNVVVEYGWGCKLQTGELWQDISMRVADLVTFIASSIEKGIFLPGQADLLLQDRDQSFECLLCRDSDIHLSTDNDAILAEATRRWMDKGYGGFKLASAEDWEPI